METLKAVEEKVATSLKIVRPKDPDDEKADAYFREQVSIILQELAKKNWKNKEGIYI